MSACPSTDADAIAYQLQKLVLHMYRDGGRNFTLENRTFLTVLKEELSVIVGEQEVTRFVREECMAFTYMLKLRKAAEGDLKARMRKFSALPDFPKMKNVFASKSIMHRAVRRRLGIEKNKLQAELIGFVCLAHCLSDTCSISKPSSV